MPASALRILERSNADYIKSQIESGNPVRTKNALQYLCKLYRRGYRIHQMQRNGMELAIVGLLGTRRPDEKVCRWALNSIARLGRPEFCVEPVTDTLKKCSDQPQIAAAGIAALFKLTRNASSILAQSNLFSPQMVALAALQHVDAKELDLSELPLKLDTAMPDDLKLALVVVGLDRAPINLFHPRHDNAQIVKALGKHHDNIVSQYTVWAITENPHLGIGDLGIELKDVEQQSANVRSWMFQLIGMSCGDNNDSGNDEIRWDLVRLGMEDPDADARSGLATGLRDVYFDGLEPMMLDWCLTEDDPEVQPLIVDHLVRQCHRCPAYHEMAIQLYERAPAGSSMRQRMAASAERTPLYGPFRRIDFGGQNDLFTAGAVIMADNISIGNLQAGAVAINGDASNTGIVTNQYDAKTIESVQSDFSKIVRELQASNIDDQVKQEALEHVKAAQLDPAPSKIEKALAFVNRAGQLAGASAPLIELGEKIGKAIGWL